ncbi:DUF3502 domain-containing protein [Paenibacillus gorillae]|uniref:DUF3502 domain-containing protein n=1 Tax=Paenibacillus gorillae TaxID=1243662 RepID=UPI0004B69CFD|nr:DUF3502 domain-containing protein [Paenibacillus gorillae]
MLFISGCTDGTEQTSALTNSPEPVQEALKPEDYESLWPGKKKLIWLSDSELLYSSSKDVLTEFNNTLLANGADFVVEFLNAKASSVQDYYDLIRRLKQEGKQVDLLNTGSGSYDVNIRTYPEAVRDGLLEPLDEYLQTKDGKLLYDHILPSSWEMVTLDRHIYGIHPMPTAAANLYLFTNKRIQEKYKITLPEHISGLDELQSALTLAAEESKQDQKFVPLYIWLGSGKEMSGYDFLGSSGIAVRHTESGAPLAFNPYAEPNVQQLLQTLSAYKEADYTKEGQAFEEVLKGNFFAFVTYAYPSTYHDGKLQLGITDPILDVNAHLLQDGMNFQAVNGINGVASWSTHKKEAFQLLTLVNTNSELSNLLRHGFKKADGKPQFKDMEEMMRGIASPSNNLITAPVGLETTNKLNDYRDYAASFSMSPAAGFTLDESKIKADLAAIGEINRKYEALWTGSKDAGAELVKANQELKAAHIDQVLIEVNKQLDSWWKATHTK